jgi:cell division septum initiation protein DivIVA
MHEARTEAWRARQDAEHALSNATAQAQQILDDARHEARRITEDALASGRAQAAADHDRIIEEARAQVAYEARQLRDERVNDERITTVKVLPTTTPIHSSEITLREFPRSARGFDRQAVSKWLALVEQSYTFVEDQLERQRHDHDALVSGLADMRRHLDRAARVGEAGRAQAEMHQARVAWNDVLDTAASTAPASRLGFDTLMIRTALMETPLRRTFAGYERDQVRRLLESSAAQLARLENQLHLAHSENDRLRSLFLEQIARVDTAEPWATGDEATPLRSLPSAGRSG